MRIRIREPLLYWLLRLLKEFDRRDASASAFDPEQVKSILLISSTALGDTVVSTSAIVAIRSRYPAARITALIHHSYADLFGRMPELDNVIEYHGGYGHFLRTALQLRKAGCDLALILHGNEPQATPFAYLSGAQFIFKLPNTSAFRFLLSNQEPILAWEDLGHGMQQRLRVAALAGADTKGARMKLPLSEEDADSVRNWLRAKDIGATSTLIGFQLGASSRGRMWPAEHFVALAQQLLALPGERRIVITGAPNEAAYCQSVAETIGDKAISTAGVFPVRQLPALVNCLSVLVTGDTGTLHVAVAVDTPIVGLFAISRPEISGPAYDLDRHVTIYRPCPDAAIRSKSNDQTCIGRIGVAEVLAAVEQVLARRGDKHG